MENIINQVVSAAISIIIGLFLIDLAANVFLDISIVQSVKDMFSSLRKSKGKTNNEDNDNEDND